MPIKNSNRGERMASKVQTLVGEILRDKYGDDEIVSSISLAGTDARGGTQFVKLYYYIPHDGNKDVIEKRMNEITKNVRFELASRMNQKYTPDIRFVYDDTLDRAERIDELLKNL